MRNRRGVSLIEAVLAVTIIAIIGNWIAMLFLSSTKSSVQVKRMAKAVSLEEMVYEQYASYAAANFFSLGGYDVNLASPQEFFKANDNFGYDGFQLTTRASYSANQSSCAIQLAINWREGVRSRTKSSSRVFTPQSILPAGANVSIQASYNGNPVPGLVVSAPSVYGGTVTVTTDASGAGLLKTVLPGPSILFSIDSNLIEYNAASGQSGYFTTVGGNYTTTLTTITAISASRFNVIPITAFRPLGTVTGHLINDDDPGVVGGQQVSLLQPNCWLYVYHAGGFRACGTDIDHCSVVTSSSGTFTFYNLIPEPGNNKIVVDGKWGSDPLVQLGQPGFEYRYINWTETTFDFSASMTWTRDLHIRRMGALRVRPLDSVTGNPLPPGTTIQVDRERLERLTIYNNPVITAVTDPITRSITLYNMVHSDSNGYIFTFYAEDYPPPGQGYFLRKDWTCPGNCMGRTLDVDLPMEAGYHFHAPFQDANPIPNAVGLKVEFESVRFRYGPRMNVLTDGTGAIDLDGFTPWMGPGTTYNGPATASFTYDDAAVDVTKPGSLLPVTVNLSFIEYNSGLPARHVKFSVQQTNTLFTTDGAGHATVTQLPYGESIRFSVHCGVQCAPTAPIQIDTRKTAIRIGPGDEPGWYIDGDANASYRQFLATDPQNMTIQTALSRYHVMGNVSDDATHAPVAGIRMLDGWNNFWAYTTHADGSYEMWLNVLGRTASDAGHVTVLAAGSDTYPALPAVVIQLPPNADPTVPLIQNFLYNPSQGGGV